jgi:hypothetical protein
VFKNIFILKFLSSEKVSRNKNLKQNQNIGKFGHLFIYFDFSLNKTEINLSPKKVIELYHNFGLVIKLTRY